MPKEPYSHESVQNKRLRDYRKLFGSDTGQKVLLDLCKRFHLLVKKTEIDLDPQVLAYTTGCHAVLNDILEKMNKNPLELKQEMVESNV